jgi:hypothetical protein
MIKTLAIACIVLVAFSSPLLAGERKLNSAEITAVLTDKVLTSASNATQIFQTSGVTFYSENGSQSQGFWKVDGDKYCSQWPPNTAWPCYDVFQDGDTIVFVSGSGKRYESFLPKVP